MNLSLLSTRRQEHSKAYAPRLLVLATLVALLTTLLWSEKLFAQVPYNFRIPPFDLPDIESSEAEAETLPESTAQQRRVIVDTDPGVDDAAALIWLYSQQQYEVEVEAIVTVAGNANVDQATYNTQMLLDWLEVDTPVVRGSDGPLSQTHSLIPWLIHGPDGLWFTGAPTVTADFLDSTAFYCNNLDAGMLVIALGPLTNIAMAMDEELGGCPAAWEGVEIISLGGSRAKPNQTPVTEYNYWQDPEAVEKVLALAPAISATVEIVLSDAFSQFEIGQSDIALLQRRGVEAIQNLLPALGAYMFGFEEAGETPTLPDPTAVIYALERRLGTSQSALVKVLAGPGIPEVARGQTIIGLTLNERITMIATDTVLSDIAVQVFFNEDFDLETTLGAILFSQPDNAMVVTDIDARRMHTLFLLGLRAFNTVPTSGSGEETQQSDYENHIYVPLISD